MKKYQTVKYIEGELNCCKQKQSKLGNDATTLTCVVACFQSQDKLFSSEETGTLRTWKFSSCTSDSKNVQRLAFQFCMEQDVTLFEQYNPDTMNILSFLLLNR